MSRPKTAPVVLVVVMSALVVAFGLRYLAAVDSGVAPVAAIRTILFWALVCVPVAILADILAREILNYRLVRVAVARVKSRR